MKQLWDFMVLAGVGWLIWLVLSAIRLLIVGPAEFIQAR